MNICTILKPWRFPLAVCCLYGLLSQLLPDGTGRAVQISASMFTQLAFPVCLALVMMVVLNRYLSPAVVTRFLGKSSGLKGALLSASAGILSMGPIYGWYPLLKTLREKGASTFHLVNFMANRSIKPVLFPVLIGYWGYRFSVFFILVSIGGALLSAAIVSLFCPDLPAAGGERENS